MKEYLDEEEFYNVEQATTDFGETFEMEPLENMVARFSSVPGKLEKVYLSFDCETRHVFKQIIEEFKRDGKSDIYQRIWLEDWRETPVDIDTFLEDDLYLGKTNRNGDSIFPFWRGIYRDVFSSENFGKYVEIAITGAIGIGKTSFVSSAMAYLLYRLMCLRNPQKYYGFKSISLISLAFVSITLNLARGVGYREFHDLILQSPWFLKHGSATKSIQNPLYIPPRGIEITPGSLGRHFLGKQVYTAFLDEVNFSTGAEKDIGTEKDRMMQTYNTISTRITSRFMRNGIVLGKAFLVSSKKAENDFLEKYIASRKGRHNFYVVDKPQWEVMPKGHFSDRGNFKIAVGNRHLKGFIIPEEKEHETEYLEELLKEGYYFMEPPLDLRDEFVKDFNTSLMDLAGVSIAGLTSFFTSALVESCYEKVRTDSGKTVDLYENPFEISSPIAMGRNSFDDIKDYFRLGKVRPSVLSMPMYIHIDLSITGDNTGISCVADAGVLYNEKTQTAENRYIHVFSVAIKAPPNDRISQTKILDFIFWLKKGGFNIREVSADNVHASEAMRGSISQNGINDVYRSVDRTGEAYITLHALMTEGRISLLRYNLLETELIQLQRNIQNNRFDHPKNNTDGSRGSKDVSDSLAGAVMGAVLNSKSAVTSLRINSAEDFDLAVSGPEKAGMADFQSVCESFGGVFALPGAFKPH